MKNSAHVLRFLGLGVLSTALMLSCALNGRQEPTDAEIEEAVIYADEMTLEVTDILIGASATGDTTELDAFVADFDLASIISDTSSIRMRPQITSASEASEWVLDNAVHGDILLFMDDENSGWTHELMQLVLVGDYFHAGVFVDTDGVRRTGDEYLVSASIRIGRAGIESGVMVQNIEEVAANRIRVGRLATGLGPGMNPALDATLEQLVALPPEETLYSFLYPNLNPVPREGDYLWYCSKVSWRAYAAAGVNTEFRVDDSSWDPSMDFYLVDDRWTAFEDTLVIQLYKKFLNRFLDRWPELVERLAVMKLHKVLTELITPDEVFYWGVSSLPAESVTVWGDTTSIWEVSDIVGEWLIDQTYQMYTDNIPIDTAPMTQTVTTLMNADGTFTFSGTTQFAGEPEISLDGSSGTYTYDDETGTLVLNLIIWMQNGVDSSPAVFTYRCEVTETTMTLTAPTDEPEAWTPAEPMIYTRQ
jgi:hypothetical protein